MYQAMSYNLLGECFADARKAYVIVTSYAYHMNTKLSAATGRHFH